MGWLRHPRTTQERRANCNRGSIMEVEGYFIKIRASRNHRNHVQAYDDIITPSPKNWKKYRKAQWRN